MSATKNIEIKEFNGIDYNVLFPKIDIENYYIWEKVKTINSEITIYTTDIANRPVDLRYNNTIYFGDGFQVQNGKFILNNVSSIDLTSANQSSLYGKFCSIGTETSTNIFYIYPNPRIEQNGSYGVRMSPCNFFSSAKEITVTEMENNGYISNIKPELPTQDLNEYEYIPLNNICAHTQIQTGSYIGTGDYGINTPNKLFFNFSPKIAFITWNGTKAKQTINKTEERSINWVYGEIADNDSFTMVSERNNLIWFSQFSANRQLNVLGETYEYTVIG